MAKEAIDPAAGSSSDAPMFTQHFKVVESGSSRTDAAAAGDAGTRAHFASNSAAMGQRAKADLRDALIWVTRFSEGAVDRRTFRNAASTMKLHAYKDVLTERHVNHLCAYPPCGNQPRRAYDAEKPVYRINLRAKRVFDTAASTKFCSDECARRSAWYETVCLTSNRFDAPSSSCSGPPIAQLLEDVEQSGNSAPAIPPVALDTTPAAYPAPITSLSPQAILPPIQVFQDEYSKLADNFLARLSIIEREAAAPPAPPNASTLHTTSEETYSPPRNGKLRNTGASLLPFDMAPLRRELLASQNVLSQDQQRQRRERRKVTFEDDENAQRDQDMQDDGMMEDESDEEAVDAVRRVEMDVAPGYEQYMDEGWSLFKEMRDAEAPS